MTGTAKGGGSAQLEDGAVVLGHFDDAAFAVVDVDGFAVGPEVEAVDGFVVVADVFVALGAAGVVVEGDAGADDVDEGGAFVREAGLDKRTRVMSMLVRPEMKRQLEGTDGTQCTLIQTRTVSA